MLSAGDPLLVAAPADWRGACLSVPAVRALKGMGVETRVLCSDDQRTFWENSGLGKVVAYPVGSSSREIARQIDGEPASLAWEAGVAADACAKAGIPRRLGPPAKGLVKRLTEPVEVIERPGPIQHRVRFFLGIAAKLGAETMVAANFAPVRVAVPLATDRVLLVPDSDFGRHYEWPLERWEVVAKALLERGKIVWIATNGPLGAALSAAIPRAEGVALELPALDDLSSCALCLAADGSVPHLAAHVGTTCVVLFGPGEPEWTRPLGKRHVVVRRKVACSPCFAPKCRMDLRCQNDLETGEVLRALEDLP
jgi:ADP-heptose:LPS heptosyltransferase